MVIFWSKFLPLRSYSKSGCTVPCTLQSKLYEHDLRTVHGKNLMEMAQICEHPVGKLTSQIVTSKLRYRAIPNNKIWRLSLGRELKNLYDNNDLLPPGFTNGKVEQMLKVCA